MASILAPKILAFKADEAISEGMVVKMGTDREHVAKATAVSDLAIGVAQSAPTAAEDVMEVAMPGGGAKGLAQTTITKGQRLTAHSDGKLKPCSANNDVSIGIALEDAVAGDLFSMVVQPAYYGA